MLSQKTFQESDISGITRLAMNCESCNTTIDYRFQTNCAHCESEQASLPMPLIQAPTASVEKRFTWTRRVISLAYILTISAAGMISGTVVLYIATAFTVTAVLIPLGVPNPGCGTGCLIGFLALASGAFLGTVGGTVFAMKHPVCK